MKVLVIGGVATGASAAARLRRLDESANIIIFERGHHVSFANCGLPYHIGGDIKDRGMLLLQTPQSLRGLLNLDVRTEQEVISINREAKTVTVRDLRATTEYDESYDKLVLAPGAVPLRPPLPGIDDERIYTLRNVRDMDQIKAVVDGGAKSAVVIGGGYIGVEMAENLKDRGLDIDLIEMAPQLMPPLDAEMARELENHAIHHGIRLHLGVPAAAFHAEGKGISVELKDGTRICGDFVVLSAGVKPDSMLARKAGLNVGKRGGIQVNAHMQTNDPDIYAGGDAIEVTDSVINQPAQIPLAGPANRMGRIIADNIASRPTTYPGSLGTSIVKIFDMTGGGVGANEKRLAATDIPYGKVYVHPSGHAGYYPGTSPMHIKLLFHTETAKILGAQVVGFDGIDKRIDVFATAIRAGLTVYDLEELELAYAPPYGAAKDPVNMAGFVASNFLRGDTKSWLPSDYPERTKSGIILDVRPAAMFQEGHINGAINIPMNELRDRMDELPKDKPIFAYCKVGFTSYLAYRLLSQKGYEVYSLCGGSMTFCDFHETGDKNTSGSAQPPFISYPRG